VKGHQRPKKTQAEKDGIAPDGQIWVCGACGKTSKYRYADERGGMWDSSCMTWAVLCFEDKVDGKWQAVR